MPQREDHAEAAAAPVPASVPRAASPDGPVSHGEQVGWESREGEQAWGSPEGLRFTALRKGVGCTTVWDRFGRSKREALGW